MALNIIDFSNGIRPEEIQDNFEYLQAQLSRERASVGGTGIASGLEIDINVNENDFEIHLSDGTIIDSDGEEVFVMGKTIKIDPPILYEYKEVLNLSKNKTVMLKYTPYAINRRVPVEFLNSYEPEVSGVNIKHKGSLYVDDYIRIRNVNGRQLTVAGALLNELEISYYYTAKRIDILYLDDKLEIKIKQGTTSTTPSAILPSDAKFLIAYLEIDNEYTNEQDIVPHAYVYVKDDLRSIRNLYTDSNGSLYVCGVPFDDLQIIHLKEPRNPKVNTLWLNVADNTLYCWRSTDEFIYKNRIEVTTDFLQQDNADLIFSTYMDFVLGGEELSVYLNDALLNLNTDYEEISKNLPTFAGNEGDELRGNVFRILQTIHRPDGQDTVLVAGDVLTYLIRYRDSQYMWVPVNKMNYIPVKNTRTYTTYYDGISDEYIYEIDAQMKRAYFDSSLANSLGINEETGYPHKYQYFLFDRVKDLDMHFTPYRKQLSVMINQMYLHEDQFKEITVYDIYEGKLPREVLDAAAERFGWTTEYLQEKFNDNFDSTGIGFMLLEPLDSGANADGIGSDYTSIYGSNDLFVEAIVEHRVCSTPIKRKLERSATFVYEDSFTVPDGFNPIVELEDVTYRYDEHQLEVFIDGVKQIVGQDYIEEFGYHKQVEDVELGGSMNPGILIDPIDPQEDFLDQDFFIRKKAAVCTKFMFLRSVLPESVVTYKITTNVYSYDHINNILDDIGETIESCNEITKTAMQRMDEVEDLANNLKNRVTTLEEDKETDDPRYLTKDSIINVGQLPNVILSNAIKSLDHINVSITLKTGQMTYSLNSINGISTINIWAADYINIFHHSSVNKIDSYWVPGLHYNVKEVISGGQPISYLEILEAGKNSFLNDDVLYISGIKLSNYRPIGGDTNE